MTLDEDFKGVSCPHCESEGVSVLSLFGGSVSEVLFQCRACRTCFNWVKWRGALPPTAIDPGGEGMGEAEARDG